MRLYNTLAGEVQEFVPADGNTVKMYICGVTPYSSTHVGHALSYVAFDVLRRYLEYLGYEVRHIQNFTDVDDKIIQKAQEQGVDPSELVDTFIDDFFEGMDSLNVQRAHVYPRATLEIGPIIDTIGTLVNKGYAYAGGGDVFFRVTPKRRLWQAEPPHSGRYACRSQDRGGRKQGAPDGLCALEGSQAGGTFLG